MVNRTKGGLFNKGLAANLPRKCSMNIAYMGGRQAGIIGLLTVQALGHDTPLIVVSDPQMEQVARSLTYGAVYRSLSEINDWDSVDLLLSVHGREIVSQSVLEGLPLGGVNVHPCLFGFKGSNPHLVILIFWPF